jgi:arabinose-5-phosphate isomerase
MEWPRSPSIKAQGHSKWVCNSAVVLDVSVEREACCLKLAPTASVMVMLALAVVLSDVPGFTLEDFAKYHLAEQLGRTLL